MTIDVPALAAPAPATAGFAALPSELLALLRCLECAGTLELSAVCAVAGYPDLGSDGHLTCTRCGERFPVVAGTVRMLDREQRSRLWTHYPRCAPALRGAGIPWPPSSDARSDDVRQRTADSFAYEWEQFGELRTQWRQNFIDYMAPHSPGSFAGRLVLDVGTGSGRHAVHAAALGAQVVAVDLGRSIDVARRNLPAAVLTVQADAERLPFAAGSFDFVMSIGVLHHLPDPQRGLGSIVGLARPGGHVHIYLYWVPERVWQVHVLRLVTAARRVTVRLPHRVLHVLCVPLAAGLAVAFVWPHRILRRLAPVRHLADALPLRTYADYPFNVLVNDQFDRFSAPLERRFTRAEVLAMIDGAGLIDTRVLANHGWIGDGTVAGDRAAA